MKLREGPPLKHLLNSLKNGWGYLFIPSPSIHDLHEREKARLLLTLLIIVLPIGLLTSIVLPPLTGNKILDPTQDAKYILYSLGMWVVVYLFARSKNYRFGAWLTIFLGLAIIFVSAIPDAEYDDFFHLTFIIIFSSLFFDLKEVLIVYVICLIGIGTSFLFAPDINFGRDIFFPSAVITIGGSLSLVGAQYLKNIGALYYKQEFIQDEQYRLLLDRTFDGMAEINNNLIVQADASFANIFGKKPNEMIGTPLTSILSHNRAMDLQKYTFEIITKNVAGEELHLELLISPVHTIGTDNQLIAIRDISERKSEEKELKRQALFDPVTGLYNRTQLLKHVQRQRVMVNDEKKTALLFLDLDDFKNVNDLFGHDTGDKLLRIVAERLQNVVRDGDVVARYGGDEFVVVCNTLVDDTDTIAQRILLTFHVPFHIANTTLELTTSIGIVKDISKYSDVDEILRAADEAMYRAKDKGKNQYDFALSEKANL